MKRETLTPETQKDLSNRKPNRELSNLVEHVFPAEISRRDAVTFFSGFDKNASRKFWGHLYMFLRGKNLRAFFDNSYSKDAF